MQIFPRIFWLTFSSVVFKTMILVHLRCYFRSEKRHNLCFLVCKIFYPKIWSCKNVEKFHVCNAAFFLSIMRCAKQYFRHCLPSQSLSTLPSNMRTIYFLCLPVFTICPQDLKYNMIGLTVILPDSLSFYLGSYVFYFLIAIVTGVHSMYEYQSDQRVKSIFFEQLISIFSLHFLIFSSSPLLPCRAHKQERSPRLAIS